MPSVRIQQTIRAAPERVFRISTDLENLARNISGIDRVEVLTEGPPGEGTRWRETRTMLGKQATEEMWCTGFEPPRRFVVEAESRGMHYRSEFLFEPDGPGTRVTVVFAGRPLSRLAKLLAPLAAVMSGGVRKALERDLEDVKRLAEADRPRSGRAAR